jgi:hypothetical protein
VSSASNERLVGGVSGAEFRYHAVPPSIFLSSLLSNFCTIEGFSWIVNGLRLQSPEPVGPVVKNFDSY